MFSLIEISPVLPVVQPPSDAVSTPSHEESASSLVEEIQAKRLRMLNQRNLRQGNRKHFTYNKTLTYSGMPA